MQRIPLSGHLHGVSDFKTQFLQEKYLAAEKKMNFSEPFYDIDKRILWR